MVVHSRIENRASTEKQSKLTFHHIWPHNYNPCTVGSEPESYMSLVQGKTLGISKSTMLLASHQAGLKYAI